MRLESEGGHAYLSILFQLSASPAEVLQQADVEARLVSLSLATLQRFQVRCRYTRQHCWQSSRQDCVSTSDCGV